MEKGLPVYQPETLRNGAFDEELRALAPDLIVVVAYGKILPQSVLDMPKYGCINVHGSLLPAYRGAAPMQRAIIEGRTETGVCRGNRRKTNILLRLRGKRSTLPKYRGRKRKTFRPTLRRTNPTRNSK